MMLKDLVQKSRSYRRFDESFKISEETLKQLVDLARLTPSASNKQPLKYILSCDSKKNDLIFPALQWAGYLEDWGGPKEGERPSAYIIMVGDSEISGSFKYDAGISAQTIMLGATEKGLGGCIVALVDHKKLQSALNISKRYKVQLVIALGKPAEKVVIDPIKEDGKIEYWRDEKSVHHVPNRSLDELLIK